MKEMNMKKCIFDKLYQLCAICLIFVMLFTGCGANSSTKNVNTDVHFKYHVASLDEAKELAVREDRFLETLSQTFLDYTLQKKGATKEEYVALLPECMRQPSDKEIEGLALGFKRLEEIIAEKGLQLPITEDIIFVKTSMNEVPVNAQGYTRGNIIYFDEMALALFRTGDESTLQFGIYVLCHELFHVLTRNNPEFREAMYSIIQCKIADEEFDFPDSIKESILTNPDVEYHNTYASYEIDGELVDCFAGELVEKPFENEGDLLEASLMNIIVPIDGRAEYYPLEKASNLKKLYGDNTDYTVDPEECMADNFAYALAFGVNGLTNEYGTSSWNDPTIIQKVLNYLQTGDINKQKKEKNKDKEKIEIVSPELQKYIDAAQSGSGKDIKILADCYYYGEYTNKDYDKAFHFYNKAVDAGYSRASVNVAECYMYGKGVKKNVEKAIDILNKAISDGFSRAYWALGRAYYYGEIDGHADYEKALEYYNKGADKDEPVCMYSLFNMYYDGVGVEKDKETAFKWLNKAADLNYSSALYTLGYLYQSGVDYEIDYEKALDYLERAAKLGNSSASSILAGMYLYGDGVDVDLHKALEYFTESTRRGEKGDWFYRAMVLATIQCMEEEQE